MVLLLGLVLLMLSMLYSTHRMIGHSMDPTMHDSQTLILDTAFYKMRGLQRGDIIVFRPPVENDSEDYVKRVIGLPGDVVEVKGGDGVYINGVKLDEPYIKDSANYAWPMSGASNVVPPGHLFVLGDNRNNSSDSHAWGFLDMNRVRGLVIGVR